MTCGYVCPQCEGTGFTANGEPCDWCTPVKETAPDKPNEQPTDEAWIKETHEGKCCADE